MLQLFSNTLIGILIGNLVGFIQWIFKRPQPIWKSKYAFQYFKSNGYLFGLAWGIGAVIWSILFTMLLPEDERQGFQLLPALFGTTGFLFLAQSIHFFDRLHFMTDRIEIKLFFSLVSTIQYTDIVLILRDKRSGSYADIIYKHPLWGITSLGSEINSPKIPASVIVQLETQIGRDKIHSTIYPVFSTVEKSLPEYPIKVTSIQWKIWSKKPIFERIYKLSWLLINPFVAMVAIAAYWGFFANGLYLLITLDMTRVYSAASFKKLMKDSDAFIDLPSETAPQGA